MAKYTSEQKLEALGKIAAGVELKLIAEELRISYSTLSAWKKELNQAKINNDLSVLQDCTELVVNETAEAVKSKLAEVAPEPEKVAKHVDNVVEGIIGYEKLSTKFQAVAYRLAKKIEDQTRDQIGSAEIESLVISLAKLQEAFFNKNVTNINVLNQQTAVASSDSVSKFKSLLRP